MFIVDTDIAPGEYFIRVHTRAPRGVYDAVLMTWSELGTELKDYYTINGSGEWNTYEFAFEVKQADRMMFRIEDDVEAACPTVINRKGQWQIVSLQRKN